MAAHRRRAVLALLVVGLIGLAACSEESQSQVADTVSGAVDDALAEVEIDDTALRRRLQELSTDVESAADDLRRRVKRMEQRLADLETTVATLESEAQRLQDAGAATIELADDVQTLSEQLDSLADQLPPAGDTALGTSCPTGETWNTTIQACVP
jgi:chromosome segregation ATPase